MFFILPFRKWFIEEHFIERSFHPGKMDTLPDMRLFEKLSACEQYYLAQHYNWDDGAAVLHWIIDSPKCDAGTASLIFWSAAPGFYFEYNEQTIHPSEKEVLLLLKKIIARFERDDFKTWRLGYDPAVAVSEIDWTKAYPGWTIPPVLKEPLKGCRPVSLSDLQSFIWMWLRRRRMKARAKRKMNRNK